MNSQNLVYIAGHRGLAGSALLRALARRGCARVLTRTHAELDLRDAPAVEQFFEQERPEYVILAAARVGGILAHAAHPAEFLRDNLLIQTNVLEAARKSGVDRLLFLASSAVYPRGCPQPMREDALLTGPLEPSVRPYALAKIAGIELCWAMNRQYGTRFLAAAIPNLYGPGDRYDPETAHVAAALLRKTAEALAAGSPEIPVWGTGEARRELLYADDLAEACLHLLALDEDRYLGLLSPAAPLINIGVGEDVSIRELAETIRSALGCRAELRFDPTKPEGAQRKLLDTTRMHGLGWRAQTSLREGIRRTWEAERERLL